MTFMLAAGAVLVVLGVAGSVSACQAGPEDRDMVVAVLSGLSLALGLSCLALGAARRGYHYRPIGAPPGDMDASTTSESASKTAESPVKHPPVR